MGKIKFRSNAAMQAMKARVEDLPSNAGRPPFEAKWLDAGQKEHWLGIDKPREERRRNKRLAFILNAAQAKYKETQPGIGYKALNLAVQPDWGRGIVFHIDQRAFKVTRLAERTPLGTWTANTLEPQSIAAGIFGTAVQGWVEGANALP